MLKHRLLAALVLLPLLLWAVFAMPPIAFQLFIAAVLLVAAWEWSGIMQLSELPKRLGYVAFIALLVALVARFIGPDITSPLLLAAVLFWVVALAWISKYPLGLEPGTRKPFLVGVVGVAVLLPLWIAACGLQQAGTITGPRTGWWVAIMLMLIFAADTGGYTFGRLFGKTKLAPHVSPGKTWEGVAGAMVGALIIVAVVWAFVPLPVVKERPVEFVLIALLTVLISIVGDLTESMFKRHSGLKDSGNIIPGHGGIMDRIDSITAAAPMFAYGLSRLLT